MPPGIQLTQLDVPGMEAQEMVSQIQAPMEAMRQESGRGGGGGGGESEEGENRCWKVQKKKNKNQEEEEEQQQHHTVAGRFDVAVGLSSKPSHSLVRVAWHTVNDSTLWTVLSGRLGEARSQPGVCRGSVSSVVVGDPWVARRI